MRKRKTHWIVPNNLCTFSRNRNFLEFTGLTRSVSCKNCIKHLKKLKEKLRSA